MSIFPRFRFPLMFRCVHDREVASLRWDIDALKQSHDNLAHDWEVSEIALHGLAARVVGCRNERDAAQASLQAERLASEAQIKNHTRALRSLNEAYQKDKEQIQRASSVMSFATFKR